MRNNIGINTLQITLHFDAVSFCYYTSDSISVNPRIYYDLKTTPLYTPTFDDGDISISGSSVCNSKFKGNTTTCNTDIMQSIGSSFSKVLCNIFINDTGLFMDIMGYIFLTQSYYMNLVQSPLPYRDIWFANYYGLQKNTNKPLRSPTYRNSVQYVTVSKQEFVSKSNNSPIADFCLNITGNNKYIYTGDLVTIEYLTSIVDIIPNCIGFTVYNDVTVKFIVMDYKEIQLQACNT
jgi:hypothetical protein